MLVDIQAAQCMSHVVNQSVSFILALSKISCDIKVAKYWEPWNGGKSRVHKVFMELVQLHRELEIPFASGHSRIALHRTVLDVLSRVISL